MSADTAWFVGWHCGCTSLEPAEHDAPDRCPEHDALRILTPPEFVPVAAGRLRYGVEPGRPTGFTGT